jgi:RNA-directed DNA polymerase
MAKIKEGGWFKRRSYNHLDYPLNFQAAEQLVSDKLKIAKWQFLPLVGYTDRKRRYRTDNSNRTIPRHLRPKKVSTKEREIRYASHRDAAVYQYYARLKDLTANF